MACFNISCLWFTLVSLVIVEFLTGSRLPGCSWLVVQVPSVLQLCPNLRAWVWVHFPFGKWIVGTEEEELGGQGVFGSHAPCSDLWQTLWVASPSATLLSFLANNMPTLFRYQATYMSQGKLVPSQSKMDFNYIKSITASPFSLSEISLEIGMCSSSEQWDWEKV